MKRTSAFLMGLFLATFLLPAQATAAPEGKIAMELTAFKQVVTVVDGKKRVDYLKVDQVNPGDTIRYDIHFTNTGTDDVYNFAIVDPIPSGVRFLSQSGIEGTITLFSVDNGLSYQEPPIFVEATGPGGTSVKKEAGPEMYTYIKWQFTEAIRPEQKGTVSFFAVVK